MGKKKSIKQLHLDSVRIRKEAYDKNQEAMHIELEIHNARGKYLFNTLRKIGYIEKRFVNCDPLRLDFKNENPANFCMTVYAKQINDLGKDARNYILPISWLFGDNSFIEEAKTIVKEQKRKQRIKNKIRKLQSKL